MEPTDFKLLRSTVLELVEKLELGAEFSLSARSRDVIRTAQVNFNDTSEGFKLREAALIASDLLNSAA